MAIDASRPSRTVMDPLPAVGAPPARLGLAALAPAERAAHARAYVEAAHARVARGIAQAQPGVKVAGQLAADMDALLQALFDAALATTAIQGRTLAEAVAVVATGGYGRAELCPHSDLDLLLVCAREPDERVQTFAE